MLTSHNVLLGYVPGYPEIIVVLVIAVILFGRRLPEVARSFGKSIVEFKRGLRDVQNEVDSASDPPNDTSEKPTITDKSSDNSNQSQA